MFLAVLMLLSSVAVGQATADASELEFAKDEVLRPGQSCPEGTRDLGRDAPGRLAVCRPDGFVPIATPTGSEALCDLAFDAGVHGQWIEGDPVSVCWHSYSWPVPESGCWTATIETTVIDRFSRERRHACVSPILVKGLATPTTTVDVAPTPICINDETLLGDDNAAELKVGQIYLGEGSAQIVTTGASCGFDCYDGFDVNCDSKLGDYCASELDRRTVAGAKACLASPSAE